MLTITIVTATNITFLLAYLTKFPYIILINVAAKDGED
jgi:hypothetical protein